MDQVGAMKKELSRVRQQKRELKTAVEMQQELIEKLKGYIAELEEKLGDPGAGGSAVAKDLLNAEKQLKAMQSTYAQE